MPWERTPEADDSRVVRTARYSEPDRDAAPRAARRALFPALALGAAALVSLALFVIWGVSCIGLPNLHPAAPYLLAGVLLALALLLLVGAGSLLLSALTGRPRLLPRPFLGIFLRLFFPLARVLGRCLGFSRDAIRASFVTFNNQLVRMTRIPCAPTDVLVLVPHCLQNSRCPVRLTFNVENCRHCGQCGISGIIRLCRRYGVFLAVVTGGTVARRIVAQRCPRMILAVACERDLVSGIQDTVPLPVFGVLNERPHGPCYDTQVSLSALEEALVLFLGRRIPEEAPAPEDVPTCEASPSGG